MKENKSHPKLEKRLGRCKPLEEAETFFSAVKQPTVTPLTLKPVGQEPMGTGLWGAWEEGRECSLQPTVLSGRDFAPMQCLELRHSWLLQSKVWMGISLASGG